MGRKLLKEVAGWILLFLIAIGSAKLINEYVLLNVKVPSSSMENTIMTDDRVIGLRCAYLFSEPERGDIVVFPYPDDENVDFIKRVIGLPGETVEGKDGLVYIDGKPLDEEYVKDAIAKDFGPYEVPKNCYFMMGDNRNDSKDSRYWDNKYVKKNTIKGKAYFKYPNFAWLDK